MDVMEIDLNCLPIPDWGLCCPTCRYPLRGLPSHRCPECGTLLDMTKVVKSWHRLRDPRFSGHELPLPDFGLLCRACQQPLAGAPTHHCSNCGLEFDPEAIRPYRKWFLVDEVLCGEVPLAGMEALLANEYVPYLRRGDKLLREIFGGTQVIGSRLLVPAEFFFELLWLIRRAVLEMEEARRQPESANWTCPHCGEEVPAHFDVCWNCQSSRPK